jgi:osomolarity two-component system response regulator SSK1
MQALIDFEGWRKWRGFLDSPRPMSPSFDSAASPLQSGTSPNQTEAPSPSITRTKSKVKGIKRPSLPEAAEVLREDSWGSGSGDTGDSSAEATPAESDKPSETSAPPPEQ